MSEPIERRNQGDRCSALALLAIALVSTTGVARDATASSGSYVAEDFDAETASHRRCEWRPKGERCYWVKTDGKITAPR